MSSLGKNAQRIKNILSGDYTGKTKIQLGYKKKEVDYQEGDIWEEEGKTWTIKDGIKQSISKLDKVRELVKMPYVCPVCKKPMKHRLDKKFWNLKRQCFDCTIEEDTNRMHNGTFSEYEKNFMVNNMTTWLNDINGVIKDYIEQSNNDKVVTEDGAVENWVGGYSKEKLQEIFDEQIEKAKEKLEDFKNEKK